MKASLLLSNRYYIRQVDLHRMSSDILAQNLTNSVALDFDSVDNCIYWSEVTAVGSSIKRMCLNGSQEHQVGCYLCAAERAPSWGGGLVGLRARRILFPIALSCAVISSRRHWVCPTDF